MVDVDDDDFEAFKSSSWLDSLSSTGTLLTSTETAFQKSVQSNNAVENSSAKITTMSVGELVGFVSFQLKSIS